MRDWPCEPPVRRVGTRGLVGCADRAHAAAHHQSQTAAGQQDHWPGRAERLPGRVARGATVVAGRGRHPVARAARVAVAMVSVVVFGATGYGWAQMHDLATGLSTVDVIDPATQSPLGAPSVDAQNILLVGLDTRTDAQGNPLPVAVLNQLHAGASDDGGDTTDTMIVIHIPAGGGPVTAISIPRDSYVSLANGFGQHKINSAFTSGKVAAENRLRAHGVTGAALAVASDQAGAKTTIQTVAQFTGLTINHYAAINLAGFYFLSQAVGGVAVCLKAPVHDSYSGANFPAGPQTVSGAQALAFVRQRHGLPHGDLDRIIRQQAFMASMAQTVLSTGTLTDPTKLNNLIAVIKKTTVLDSGWDIISFAQQLSGISAGDIRFVTIPIVTITLPTPSDGDAVEVNPQQVQAFIQQQINGPHDPSASPTSPAPATTSVVTVDVLNANGTTGLARQVLDSLAAQGFATGQASNATIRTTTVIDYAAGAEVAAARAARALGGRIRLAQDPTLTANHLRVYLGEDFTTPELHGIAPAAFHHDIPPPQQARPPAGLSTPLAGACID